LNRLVHVPLGEVAKLNPTFKSANATPDKLVDFLPMSAVSAELTTVHATEQRRFSEVQKGYTNFADGDVLLAKITPCFENGKISFANVATDYGFGSTEFHVIRADRQRLDGRYLVHFLRRDEIRVDGARNMTGSAGQRRVPKHYLESLSIPLPPLPEQRRIAAILDQADALRAKRREALAQLDSLTQSIFIEMFGDPVTNSKNWDLVRLGNEAKLQGGFAFKSSDYVASGIRLVKISNVHKDDLTWDDVDQLPCEYLDTYKAFSLNRDDIVLALTRPIIQSLESVKIAVVSAADIPSLLNQRVGRFVFHKSSSIEPSYLVGFCRSTAFFNAVKKFCSESLQPNMSTSQVENLLIPLPPLVIQREYAKRIRAIEALMPIHYRSLSELDALFASLQHRAFRGEL
jgi:type I restriction enzyme S subunit